jgi:hypothetical protein
VPAVAAASAIANELNLILSSVSGEIGLYLNPGILGFEAARGSVPLPRKRS